MIWRRRDSKYGNVPTVFRGRIYHSKKEAARAQELVAMEQAGLHRVVGERE